MSTPQLEAQIDTVVKRLALALQAPPAVLEPEVRAAFAEWGDARVRDFVPIFVERSLRDRLRTSTPSPAA